LEARLNIDDQTVPGKVLMPIAGSLLIISFSLFKQTKTSAHPGFVFVVPHANHFALA
jgi:hypothetical protein